MRTIWETGDHRPLLTVLQDHFGRDITVHHDGDTMRGKLGIARSYSLYVGASHIDPGTVTKIEQ